MTAISRQFRDGRDRIFTLVDGFIHDDAGNASVEYTVMVGFISFAIVASLAAIGRVIDEDVFSVLVEAAAAI
ncbi:hypothetical protein [Stappia stellulata]|uniref:hypothetical protein n=1 Tax=Stappia stellulata TaxID=71235 RepID=UPI000413D174|nr:hypothetical protein [Stappia stellulata]